MFSLFHFSRVFPFIHPYLFPVEKPSAVAAAAPVLDAGSTNRAEPGAGNGPREGAPSETVCNDHPVNPKRLKNLYRRHQLNQRHHTFTHSGALRPT